MDRRTVLVTIIFLPSKFPIKSLTFFPSSRFMVVLQSLEHVQQKMLLWNDDSIPILLKSETKIWRPILFWPQL